MKSISIHAAREGGDAFRRKLPEIADISIHAAREGGDPPCVALVPFFAPTFQSTPPVKAATEREEEHPPKDGISIHAAREGGDIVQL